MNPKKVTATVLLALLSAILTFFIHSSIDFNSSKVLAQVAESCQTQIRQPSSREPQVLRRQAESLNGLGDRCLSEENYTEGIRFYQQALTILEGLLESYDPRIRENLISKKLYLESLYDLGFAHFSLAQGDSEVRATALVDAERVLVQALDELNVFRVINDSNGQTSARASFTDFGPENLEPRISRLLQRVLVDKGQPNDALLVAEAGRTVEVDKNIFYHLFWLYNQAWSKLDWDRFIEISRQLSPEPTLEEVQRVAQLENATLVNYSIVSDQKILVWLVHPTGQITFKEIDFQFSSVEFDDSLLGLPDRGQQDVALAQLIRDARQSLGVGELNTAQTLQVSQDQQSQYLRELYQLLIDPIEDFLPTDPESNVIILPQGPLFFVPFPALQNASGQYLIQQHTIRTAPSLRTLLLNQHNSLQSPPNQGEILIVGNPTMPRVRLANSTETQTLAALPGAENEARGIAQLLQNQFDVNLLVNDRATEEEVTEQMEEAQIIHLATHGIIDTTFQELGGAVREASGAIALAPTDDDESDQDGLLTAPEILNLRLKADLVVLSACNTGRGQLTAGGVIGLPFSLSIAGAHNIILSLWAVPDAATKELMLEFYTQLLESDGNKARALRQAMLKVMQMEEYRDPKNWAAFALTGATN